SDGQTRKGVGDGTASAAAAGCQGAVGRAHYPKHAVGQYGYPARPLVAKIARANTARSSPGNQAAAWDGPSGSKSSAKAGLVCWGNNDAIHRRRHGVNRECIRSAGRRSIEIGGHKIVGTRVR